MSDTTPRDQLADDIGWLLLQHPHPEMPDFNEAEVAITGACVAGAVEGLGWRPPARVVTTVEEAEALAEGTIVVDSAGDPGSVSEGVCYYLEGAPVTLDYTLKLAGPLTVLWEPTKEEDK